MNAAAVVRDPARPDVGEAVVAAMRAIYDSCSVAAGTPVSLYDMGMLEDWALRADGVLEVRLCVTFGACTMAPHFARALEEQLRPLPGVADVVVSVDATLLWSAERMTEAGRALLADRPRRFTARDLPKPREWMTREGTRPGTAPAG